MRLITYAWESDFLVSAGEWRPSLRMYSNSASAVRDGDNFRTSLVSMLVDDVANSCSYIQGHLMLGREEYFRKVDWVGILVAAQRDRV